MPKRSEAERLEVAGREVSISNPHKVLFPKPGHTKLDLVRYYLAVAEGALRGAGGRPNMLVRYPNGVDGEFFYQKRAPKARPDWIEVVELRFPSGRAADEVVPRDAAALAWMANLACLELHPHPVRAEDLEHPDELRVDLDPVPGVKWPQVREVAQVVEAVLGDFELVGWPKTSGKRGLHVYVRIEKRWGFDEVRRAALALAREVERRAPAIATSTWWKEERHGVFVDYNQNAKDRTVAAAYSVRPTEDATVSAPLAWDRGHERGAGRLHARHHARALQEDRRPARRHHRQRRVARAAARAIRASRAWAMRPGRRTTRNRKTSRRACSHRSASFRSSRSEGPKSRKTPWRAWSAGRSAIPVAAAHLEPADVLVDSMRGRSSTWTRIRINLQHVPEKLRPGQEPLDPDEKTLSSS